MSQYHKQLLMKGGIFISFFALTYSCSYQKQQLKREALGKGNFR